MYPSETEMAQWKKHAKEKWWIVDNPAVIPKDQPSSMLKFKAKTFEDQTHLGSRDEFELQHTANHVENPREFMFRDIIQQAMSTQVNWMDQCHQNAINPLEDEDFRPFTNTEAVNLSCLLDRGRRFEIDLSRRTAKSEEWIHLRVNSYKVSDDVALARYLGKTSQAVAGKTADGKKNR